MAAAILGLAALGLGAALPSTAAVSTSPPPILQRSTANVTADALPTAQVQGIVWKQVIAGNTVFAGGKFASARPAGVARGGAGTVTRSNLMSYDIRTGKLKSFAPVINGQILALAVSPDKKVLYVGGDFTTVNGTSRTGFAAFTVSSGKLRSLAPQPNAQVRSITTVDSKVYFGGWFTAVDGTKRRRLAAVSATTGKLLSWNPGADASVEALVVNPSKTRVIAGGYFSTLGGKTARGMGAVTTVAGSPRTWKANTKIKDYGTRAAILDLAVDKDTVYGAAYGYQDGNYEGVFAVSTKIGAIKWLQDCHGDQYGVAPVGGRVYSVGHAHYCKNIGGFSELEPQRALAVTKDARGTIKTNGQTDSVNYKNWAGYKAPAIYNWFPKLSIGNVSGSHQAAWSIEGTSKYLVLGGEFTTANGQPQEGLVRFATPAADAPEKMGPRGSASGMTPQVLSSTSTSRKLGWLSNYDLDDHRLTYQVARDGKVITTFSRTATYYSRPQITWTDTTAKAGVRYTYQIRVKDADGNMVRSTIIAST